MKRSLAVLAVLLLFVLWMASASAAWLMRGALRFFGELTQALQVAGTRLAKYL